MARVEFQRETAYVVIEAESKAHNEVYRDIGWIDYRLRENNVIAEDVQRLILRAFEAGKQEQNRLIRKLIGIP